MLLLKKTMLLIVINQSSFVYRDNTTNLPNDFNQIFNKEYSATNINKTNHDIITERENAGFLRPIELFPRISNIQDDGTESNGESTYHPSNDGETNKKKQYY